MGCSWWLAESEVIWGEVRRYFSCCLAYDSPPYTISVRVAFLDFRSLLLLHAYSIVSTMPSSPRVVHTMNHACAVRCSTKMKLH